MGAICKGCGKNVGCGCQLVNGLCSACRGVKKIYNDGKSQINNLLCRLF